ncbi:MNN13 [Candida pseudojiufengensis]|uniref:MNN13 n=1 Tax=Candida pseudojiufengensis TaxID=497109 RepID=UPI0022244E0F|nr:MNN13 [Candida pseudojiufengensis]KAI5958746.1 MNN13 [Candida pseudojiufengensis]
MLYWYNNHYYNDQDHFGLNDFSHDHSIYNLYDDHYKPIENDQKLPPKETLSSSSSTVSTSDSTGTIDSNETGISEPSSIPNDLDQQEKEYRIKEEKLYQSEIKKWQQEQYQQNLSDFKFNNPFYEMLKTSQNLTKQKDQYSSIYDSILKDHSLISIIKNLNFNQRCDLFFKHIYLKNQNWNFNPNEDYNVHEDGRLDEYKIKNFKILKYKYSQKINKSYMDIDDHEEGFKEFMKNDYKQFMQKDAEQRIIESLSILRIYNKCYVTNDDKLQQQITKGFINNQKQFIKNQIENNFELLDPETRNNPNLNTKEKFKFTKFEKLVSETHIGNKFQHRMYPWLSFEHPVFERWTGQILNHPPNFKKIMKDKNQPPPINNYKLIKDKNLDSNFFKDFKNQCNGKGIVLSVADKHVNYVVNLIHLLRALNNKLPIQIVYFNDLNDDTKKKIVTAARENYSHLPNSFAKVSNLFPKDYLDKKNKGLTKQEIWFVNTANVINDNYKNKFHGFANKLLATLFNSFNEFMLLDADTVMMQPPEFFFQLKGYLNTGSFFFKDRGVLQRRSKEDIEFFKNLSPSTIDSIIFDIPNITNHTLNQNFFKGLHHQMESGLVLINKPIHFNSILMINHLNLIHTITNKVYGDKELFWLGFAINGDENYHFSKFNAASIGSLTPMGERLKPDKTKHHSKELCSPHPGHINEEDEHSLLWMNSGFRYCHQAPKIDFEKESKKGGRLKFLKNEPSVFKDYYFNPLKIRNAIIPPLDTELKDHPNNQDEPSSGWIMDGNYCSSYLWCAYSSIGGKTNDNTDNTMDGILIEFNSVEKALFDYYGDIWIGME